MSRGRKGDWIQTYTGRKFWPLEPRPEDVDIVDIAHSLSMQCRYAGHCENFYSVAEHSVLIARWLFERPGRLDGEEHANLCLSALLHDAAEAYLVDVPRPVKPYLGGYAEVERRVHGAVCDHLDVPRGIPLAIKNADSRIIADELVNLRPMKWHRKHLNPLGVSLRYWSPLEAKQEFLATFARLTTLRPHFTTGDANAFRDSA